MRLARGSAREAAARDARDGEGGVDGQEPRNPSPLGPRALPREDEPHHGRQAPGRARRGGPHRLPPAEGGRLRHRPGERDPDGDHQPGEVFHDPQDRGHHPGLLGRPRGARRPQGLQGAPGLQKGRGRGRERQDGHQPPCAEHTESACQHEHRSLPAQRPLDQGRELACASDPV